MWNYQKNILVCMIAGLGLSTCTPSDVSIPGAATIDVMNTRVRDKDCVKNRVKRAKIVRFTLC